MSRKTAANKVNVEIIGKKGGGRTYSYGYNLHYSVPRAGDPVVVPFGGSLSPAVVLNSERSSNHEPVSGLRPILGVSRGGIMAELAQAASMVMRDYLRPAEAACSLMLPGGAERNIGLSFFCPGSKTRLLEYVARLGERKGISKKDARWLLQLLKGAQAGPRPFTKAIERRLLGAAKKAPPGKQPAGLLTDRELQALVNFGLLRLEADLRYKELVSPHDGSRNWIPGVPNLFAETGSFAPVSGHLCGIPASGSIEVFHGELALDELLCSGILEIKRFLDSANLRKLAVLLPTQHWCERALAPLQTMFGNVIQYPTEATYAQQRKCILAFNNTQEAVIVGTRSIASLLWGAGPMGALVADATSEFSECEPTLPDATGLLMRTLSRQSKIWLHTFHGAGNRICGIPPRMRAQEKSLRTALTREQVNGLWEAIDLANWTDGGREPVVNLAAETIKLAPRLLVIYNRLGMSGGFLCPRCGVQVYCTNCGGLVHRTSNGFLCSSCRHRPDELACPSCGEPGLARAGAGMDLIADELAGVVGKKNVGRMFSEEQPATTAGIVIATNVVLSRPPMREFDAIIVCNAEDLLRRNPTDGPEKAAEYLARIIGVLAGNRTKLIVASNDADNAFFHHVRGRNTAYFEQRFQVKKEWRLPPFNPSYVVRVRARTTGDATDFGARLMTGFPDLELLEPRFLAGASGKMKTYELSTHIKIDYGTRKLIVEEGRRAKVEAIPYVVYY